MSTDYRGYPPMDPDTYRIMRRLSGYTQIEIARLAGVTDRSARRWEHTHYPPEIVQRVIIDRLEEIREKARALDVQDIDGDRVLVHDDPDVVAAAWLIHGDPGIYIQPGVSMPSASIPTARDAGRGPLELRVEQLEERDVVYDVRGHAHYIEHTWRVEITPEHRFMRFTRDDGREERHPYGTVFRAGDEPKKRKR